MLINFKFFTKSMIVILLIFILVGMAFGFKFIVNKKAVEVEQIGQDLALASHKRENLSKLKRSLSDMEGDIIKINNFTLEKEKLVLFIEDLENLSSQAGVEVLVDSVKEGEQTVFVVKASGSFSSLHRLVGLIENMPYPILIEDLNLEKLPEGVWQAEVTIRLLSLESKENKK